MPLTMEETPQILPLDEKRRVLFPKTLFGQDKALRSIRACLCYERPLDMLLLGQEGVGKLTAARIAFDEAIRCPGSYFSFDSPFVVCDALMEDESFYECVKSSRGGALFLRGAENLSKEREFLLINKREPGVVIASCDKRSAVLSSELYKNCVRINFELLRVCDIRNILEDEALRLGINIEAPALSLISGVSQDAPAAIRLMMFALNIAKSRGSLCVDKASAAEAKKLLGLEVPITAGDSEVGESFALGVLDERGCIIPVEAKLAPGDGVWINESAGYMARDAARSAYFAVNELTGGALHGLKAVFNIKGGGNVDGPSLGLSLASCLISLIKGRPIKKGVAMTGEVSLSGSVLPVGRVDVKSSGACNWGVKNIWLPTQNAKDARGRGASVTGVNSLTQIFQLI